MITNFAVLQLSTYVLQTLCSDIYVDGTHVSQPLDLSIGKILFQSHNLLPTSDNRAPLINMLLSHMSIKGLRALRLVPFYSPCAYRSKSF